MIEVNGFCKVYDETVAVQNLSFNVAAGQILGLVGRNGAGKTTTLRAITGIIPASKGDLKVGGFEINQSPIEVKKRTAYVPDDPQLFTDLSVEQHLKFQASVYGIPNPSSEIMTLLEMFELEPKRHTRASGLSRGMRQKLAICCAYLQNPNALLLDEPMTGLDPQAIRVLKSSIVEKAQKGAAVIISSHLLAMVEDVCTHVMVLNAGRRRFLGSLQKFRDTFIADDKLIDASSLEQAFFGALSNVEDCLETELGNAAIMADQRCGTQNVSPRIPQS